MVVKVACITNNNSNGNNNNLGKCESEEYGIQAHITLQNYTHDICTHSSWVSGKEGRVKNTYTRVCLLNCLFHSLVLSSQEKDNFQETPEGESNIALLASSTSSPLVLTKCITQHELSI